MIEEYFNTLGLTGGMLAIFGVGIVIFLLVAIIAERRTRLIFPERKKKEGESDFSLFDDDE